MASIFLGLNVLKNAFEIILCQNGVHFVQGEMS